MKELKTVNIEIIALKSGSVMIHIEYLNEKNEHCMRTDKIRSEKIQSLMLTHKLIKKIEEYDPNIDINIKHTL